MPAAAALVVICCGPGLSGCAADCAAVRQADATQWVLAQQGVAELRGTGFRITYNAAGDTYSVSWGDSQWFAGTLEAAQQSVADRLQHMQEMGQKP